MQNSLAIVIPAFKPDYLEKALSSLACQTCLDFSVYIGDDASPYDLKCITDKFSGILNLTYHRFSENMGATNLVGQWERCVKLCKDEKWVCLFSDDDMMECGCIDAFSHFPIDSHVDVLHFDIDIIDENDNIIQECPKFPSVLDSGSFFNLLFRHQLVSRMPEFIFRKERLLKEGFVSFDLAWRSDTATVIKLAYPRGIHTITGKDAKVLWRASHANISGDPKLKERKNKVNIKFFNWVHSFFANHAITIPMRRFYLLKTIVFALEWNNWQSFIEEGWKASKGLKFISFPERVLFMLFVFYRLPYRLKEIR